MASNHVYDLLAFQLRALLAIDRNQTLDENLRIMMAPGLAKLRRLSRADLAMHVFCDSDAGEGHVLVVGACQRTQQKLKAERLRQQESAVGRRPADLPEYLELNLAGASDLADQLDASAGVRKEQVGGGLSWLLEEVRRQAPSEFPQEPSTERSTVILLPLGRGDYRRLGTIVLLNPADSRAQADDVLAFGTWMEQMLIGMLVNLYNVEPHTYLPRSHRVGPKPAGLLCAQITDFERIASILRSRREFDRYEASECLRRLVNAFAETATRVVDEHRGRVDQMWGDGFVAVFEDARDPNGDVACKWAVTAAAELVERFEESADRWLKSEFRVEDFRKNNNESIELATSIAVDYGEVVFDYIGSARNRLYMGVGDHVSFAKQLADITARTPAVEDELRRMFRLRRERAGGESRAVNGRDAPAITLSQAAYMRSKDILRDQEGDRVGIVHEPLNVRLAGESTPYAVYCVGAGNIERRTRTI